MLIGILEIAFKTIDLKPQCVGGIEECRRIGKNCRKVPVIPDEKAIISI